MDTQTTEKRPLVLVVDDDEAIRMLVREALEQSDFEVAEADDGQTALTVFESQHPDIVLLDVMMKEMDGFEACSALRGLPDGESTPVLMMTGLDDDDSINRAYQAGATDFVTKPINHAILAQRLRYVLRAQQATDDLRDNQKRLANAQRIAGFGYWEWDVDSDTVILSEGIREIFGISQRSKVTFETLLEKVHPSDLDLVRGNIERSINDGTPVTLEHRILLPKDEERVVYQEAEVVSDPTSGSIRLAATVQDVTKRKRAEQKILQLAYYDSLTGLPNRAFFKEHLEYLLKIAKRYRRRVAILSFDLDLFKRVNDTLGHDAGDELLRLVAERVTGCLRRSDFIARRLPPGYENVVATGGDAVVRLGGDEFIILLSEIREDRDASTVARRVSKQLSEPYQVKGQEVFVTSSIGMSLYPLNGEDAEELIKKADVALYHAKETGRNNCQYYSESLNTEALELLTLGNGLHTALERDEIFLHYQPKVDVQTRQTVGMEALIRWQHPKLGLVSPTKFIPLAEDAGLICELGAWVLRTACEQCKAWQAAGFPPLRVAVNVSARQFRQPNFRETIRETLGEVGLDSEWLELEVTEGILMEDVEASTKILDDLKSMGLRIALDDFGTGYSSLSYLKRLPIDSLKIDQSFIRDITKDPDSAAIVSAITSMAKSLSLKVVAEGVETRDQLACLSGQHCHEIQGYVVSKSLSADEFTKWLEAGRPGEYMSSPEMGRKERHLQRVQ